MKLAFVTDLVWFTQLLHELRRAPSDVRDVICLTGKLMMAIDFNRLLSGSPIFVQTLTD